MPWYDHLPFMLTKSLSFFVMTNSFIDGILLKQRQAAQCVGRVIRSKADYGMMIFADKRYQYMLLILYFVKISKLLH